MLCEDCLSVGETRKVVFYQNIGVLLMRFPKTIEGNMCKSCIDKHFTNATIITFFFGWWGIISAIVTPFILGSNIVQYLRCLNMSSRPAVDVTSLDDATIDQLNLFNQEIRDRLSFGEDVDAIASSVSQKSGVALQQVVMYTSLLHTAQSLEKKT